MNTTSTTASSSKKSIFKRPTWATTASPIGSNDFFRHSDTVYGRILQEKERRRERHAQRKKAEIGMEAVSEGREIKRRRLSSDEEEQEEDGQVGLETATTGSWRRKTTETETTETETVVNGSNSSPGPGPGPPQTVRAISSKADSSVKRNTPAGSQVIELDSDDDTTEAESRVIATQAPAQPLDEEVSEEEDAYVLELKQKAREKARLKTLVIGSDADQDRPLGASEPQQRLSLSFDDRSSIAQQSAAQVSPPKKDDTVVQILITTTIPNAKPLVVDRKVSQPMQLVREFWCAQQHFDDIMKAQVIFTWRGKRLYNTTTSTHLLDVLKKERARRTGGLAGDDDEEDPSNGMIEVKAMTKDMYEQENMQKNRDDVKGEMDDLAELGIRDQQSAEASTKPKEPEYTIVMKAKGLEALPLKVRSSTAISKIMAGFKRMRDVDPAKTCWLVHDADRLEPDSTVGDTEIEDGDAVEVYIR